MSLPSMDAPIVLRFAIRERLYKIIFEADTIAGRTFDFLLFATIIASVVMAMLSSVIEIRIHYGKALYWSEWGFTGLFTVEYCLRLIAAKQLQRYAFSFLGLVDLIAILPTYISVLLTGAHPLVPIRVLRLLQIFRIFKLTQFLQEERKLLLALIASIRKITIFLYTILILVIVIGSCMYLIEGENNGFTTIPQSIYWAIVTLSTVGYGDIAPQTALGKLLAAIIMLLGYGIIAVPTGIVVSDLSHPKSAAGSTPICNNCGAREHGQEASALSKLKTGIAVLGVLSESCLSSMVDGDEKAVYCSLDGSGASDSR